VGTGPLEPGRYRIRTLDAGFNASRRITIDVPEGYSGEGGWIVYKYGFEDNAVSVWVVGDGFADACGWRGTESRISSADGLAATLVHQKALRPSTPTDVDVTVGSDFGPWFYLRDYVELTTPAPAKLDRCDKAEFRVFTNSTGGPRYLNNPGEHDLLWLLELDGVPLVIDAPLAANASAQDRAELIQMVESIQINPRK
jgi:hypothetical protein